MQMGLSGEKSVLAGDARGNLWVIAGKGLAFRPGHRRSGVMKIPRFSA
jgi:hypothetical protein